MSDSSDGRRHPRLPFACRAEINDRFATWAVDVLDVGPRGCRFASPRTLSVGGLVRLALAPPRGDRLEVAGLVAWTTRGAPAQVGISFAGSTSSGASLRSWFHALVGGALAELRAGARSDLENVEVYLAAPPPGLALDPDEATVIASVGDGTVLGCLVRPPRGDAVTAALLANGSLTLVRREAVPGQRWAEVLARRRRDPADAKARGVAKPRPPGFESIVAEVTLEESVAATRGRRSPLAQWLLERGLAAFRAGRTDEADVLLRRCAAVADDETVQLVLACVAERAAPRRSAGAAILLDAGARR